MRSQNLEGDGYIIRVLSLESHGHGHDHDHDHVGGLKRATIVSSLLDESTRPFLDSALSFSKKGQSHDLPPIGSHFLFANGRKICFE
jgi:hypothetical protein